MPIDPAPCPPSEALAPRPEVLVSAALHLMSAYCRDGGCTRLAMIILRHLELIAERPDVAPVVRQTCAQLIEEWERLLPVGAGPRGRQPGRSAAGPSSRGRIAPTRPSPERADAGPRAADPPSSGLRAPPRLARVFTLRRPG